MLIAYRNRRGLLFSRLRFPAAAGGAIVTRPTLPEFLAWLKVAGPAALTVDQIPEAARRPA